MDLNNANPGVIQAQEDNQAQDDQKLANGAHGIEKKRKVCLMCTEDKTARSEGVTNWSKHVMKVHKDKKNYQLFRN